MLGIYGTLQRETRSRFVGFSVKRLDILAAFLLLVLWQHSMPEAVDVERFFQPAAKAMIQGLSPYSIAGFYNPAWIVWPMLPIAWMSTSLATLLIRSASLIGYLFISRYMGCSLPGRIGLIFSPPVLYGLMSGGFDGVVLLGLMMSPWLGFLLLVVKPQLTIGAMALGMKRRYPIWPVLALFGITTYWFGYPLIPVEALSGAHWSSTLWPWGLLIGIPLLGIGLLSEQEDISLASSPFLAPYTSGASWSSLMLLVARRWPYLLLSVDVLCIVWGALTLVLLRV